MVLSSCGVELRRTTRYSLFFIDFVKRCANISMYGRHGGIKRKKHENRKT